MIHAMLLGDSRAGCSPLAGSREKVGGGGGGKEGLRGEWAGSRDSETEREGGEGGQELEGEKEGGEAM